jgi:hypothetical protein
MALGFVAGEAIQCYQCSSGQEPKGEDSCGAYKKFDKNRHIAVECSSDESYTPGTFCMKITQQGPKGFICKFELFICCITHRARKDGPHPNVGNNRLIKVWPIIL